MFSSDVVLSKDAPPASGDLRMVVLADHLLCRVNYFLSSFVRSMLDFYGIQLFHLTPNLVIFLCLHAFVRGVHQNPLGSRLVLLLLRAESEQK